MKNTNTETPAEFVSRIMHDKNLTGRDVERNSEKGDLKITQSYVNRIRKGVITNLTPAKQKDLARGLGVTVEEVSAVFRGANPEPDEFSKKVLNLVSEADNWTEAQKKQFIATVQIIVAGIRSERKGT